MKNKKHLQKTTACALGTLLLLASPALADPEIYEAPFSLDFGMNTGNDDGEGLLMTPSADPFTLDFDSIQMTVGHASAMAIVDNLAGVRFALRSQFRWQWFVPENPDDRVGFAVLGGPHDPPGSPFDTTDGEFYALTWSPSIDATTSVIEIREGFEGTVLADAVWTGRHPTAANPFDGNWQIYQIQAVGVYDATGALELTLTLTDEGGHSQSISASIAEPREGNLFGFGGTLSSDPGGNPQFGFLNFSVSNNVILNEEFVDGERLLQELPRTAAWYGTGGSLGTMPSSIDDPEGILTIGMGVNAQILAYFTDGAPVSLAVGESLEISFGFQMTGAANAGQGVRVAVMDSSPGGGRAAADGTGTAPGSGLYNGYTGYGVFFAPLFNPDQPTRRANIRKRDPANNALLSSNGVWPGQTPQTGEIVIADNTDYSGEIFITRLSDGVEVSYNLSGPNFATVSQTFTDTGSELFSYDTFAIWLNQSAGDSFSLTSADITVLPAEAPGGATFAAWQAEHFPGETDPDIIGPDAILAGDGIRNFLKYAFGLDPFTPATLADFIEAETVGGALRLTYLERIDALDIEYIPEVSFDLLSWASGPGNVEEVSSEPLGDDFNRVTVQAIMNGSEPRAFLRVSLQEK